MRFRLLGMLALAACAAGCAATIDPRGDSSSDAASDVRRDGVAPDGPDEDPCPAFTCYACRCEGFCLAPGCYGPSCAPGVCLPPGSSCPPGYMPTPSRDLDCNHDTAPTCCAPLPDSARPEGDGGEDAGTDGSASDGASDDAPPESG